MVLGMMEPSPAYRQSCADIVAITDAVQACPGSAIPPGCQPRLGRAIDRLRDLGSPAIEIIGAERISVAMQHLQMALRLPAGSAGPDASRARLSLDHARREWLRDLPMALSR